MKIKKSAIVSLSVSVFIIVYILALLTFTVVVAFIASRAVLLGNIMVSTIHVLSFIFGVAASVLAHTVAGFVIGRLADSDGGVVAITKTHTFVILLGAIAFSVLSLAGGDTIIPPLALLTVTWYLHAKLKKI